MRRFSALSVVFVFVTTRGVMSKIAEVLERLDVLEAAIAKIGHNRGPSLDDEEELPPPPKHKPVLIADRRVAERYDVVVRTLERWISIPRWDSSRQSASTADAFAS
jgi:hypothetical protein